jgi:hypothetical protein
MRHCCLLEAHEAEKSSRLLLETISKSELFFVVRGLAPVAAGQEITLEVTWQLSLFLL